MFHSSLVAAAADASFEDASGLAQSQSALAFSPHLLLIDLKLSRQSKRDHALDGLYLATWARDQIQQRMADLPRSSPLAALKATTLFTPLFESRSLQIILMCSLRDRHSEMRTMVDAFCRFGRHFGLSSL